MQKNAARNYTNQSLAKKENAITTLTQQLKT
jgi:hypothetical protein